MDAAATPAAVVATAVDGVAAASAVAGVDEEGTVTQGKRSRQRTEALGAPAGSHEVGTCELGVALLGAPVSGDFEGVGTQREPSSRSGGLLDVDGRTPITAAEPHLPPTRGTAGKGMPAAEMTVRSSATSAFAWRHSSRGQHTAKMEMRTGISKS